MDPHEMKFTVLVILILLNVWYWYDYLKTWNQTSDDGVTGKFFVGLFLFIMSALIQIFLPDLI